MRTITLDLLPTYDSIYETIKEYTAKYPGLTVEMLGTQSLGGYTVRYHAPTFDTLRDFLCEEYGGNEDFERGESDRNRYTNMHLDLDYTSHKSFFNDIKAGDVDEVTDIVISLLTSSGYSPDNKDQAGDDIGDIVQTQLTEALLRAPKLCDMLEKVDSSITHAITSYMSLHRSIDNCPV